MANKQIKDLTAAPAAASGMRFGVDNAADLSRKVTIDQVKAYILNAINTAIFAAYAPGAHTEGLLHYDEPNKALAFMTDITDVVLQIGQEMYIRAYNDSGDQIDNGEVVYITGATGGLPTIDLADGTAEVTAHAVGLATANIANGAEGFITVFGLVRDINTNSFEAGDTVWVSTSTPGALQNTEPIPPAAPHVMGTVLVKNATTGSILVNPSADHNPPQTITFTLPLRGVVDTQLFMTGSLIEEAAGQTLDYATDFPLSNNHLYLYVNSLTGSDIVTITGTSLSETTAVPVLADTETITIDASGTYYQSTKKWWEVTNVDFGPGISAINYDIGEVGYTDINNLNFELLGYRLDMTAQGTNADIRFQIIKVQDEGSGKMSLVYIEDIGVDANAAGDQIVDNLRTGGSDRSYTPATATIWEDGGVLVFKQGDFDTYFLSDENVFLSGQADEGMILRFLGQGDANITNVDFASLQLRYKPT